MLDQDPSILLRQLRHLVHEHLLGVVVAHVSHVLPRLVRNAVIGNESKIWAESCGQIFVEMN